MKYYFAIFKPYEVLCQFTPEKESDLTLKNLFDFPPDVYPIGRLDKDSEGLLFLTNDNAWKNWITNPKNKISKTYFCQLEGAITASAIEMLVAGPIITVNGKKYKTQNCKATQIPEPPSIPERSTPIRYRKTVPTSWISISIEEGKNRQVRKMCAAIGFPVLRLIRYSIGNFSLDLLKSKQIKEFKTKPIV